MSPEIQWKALAEEYAAGYQRGLTEGGLWGLGCGLGVAVFVYLLFFLAP